MTLAPALTITLADYRDARDSADVVALLDAYARDPMGGGAPLADDVKARLADDLAANSQAFSLIARLDLNASVPLDSIAYHFDIVLRGRRSTLFENRLEGN